MNLRKLAQGKPCMIRLPGCNGGGFDIDGNSKSCLCHYRLAGYVGGAQKPDDFAFGAWGCAPCHDLVDGRTKSDHDRQTLRLAHAEGCLRTQAELRVLKSEGKLL